MPAIPPHPVTDTASIAAGFYVQVGAFQHPHARGLADRLKKDGWKTVISARKNGLYAVWIGPKKTRASAEKLSKTIQRKLKIKGFIIHQKSV
ncbi:MAG: SPOR domain-containing protein, partial [Mariprofundus sp.]